ncbi:MAG: hypothetical protein AAFU65_10170, partial [Pseudomonadota bacterium]
EGTVQGPTTGMVRNISVGLTATGLQTPGTPADVNRPLQMQYVARELDGALFDASVLFNGTTLTANDAGLHADILAMGASASGDAADALMTIIS